MLDLIKKQIKEEMKYFPVNYMRCRSIQLLMAEILELFGENTKNGNELQITCLLLEIGLIEDHQYTGYLPFDSALYAKNKGYSLHVQRALLTNSCAQSMAVLSHPELLPLYDATMSQMKAVDFKNSELLTFCCMRVDDCGARVSVHERIEEILYLNDVDSPLFKNTKQNQGYFIALDQKISRSIHERTSVII